MHGHALHEQEPYQAVGLLWVRAWPSKLGCAAASLPAFMPWGAQRPGTSTACMLGMQRCSCPLLPVCLRRSLLNVHGSQVDAKDPSLLLALPKIAECFTLTLEALKLSPWVAFHLRSVLKTSACCTALEEKGLRVYRRLPEMLKRLLVPFPDSGHDCSLAMDAKRKTAITLYRATQKIARHVCKPNDTISEVLMQAWSMDSQASNSHHSKIDAAIGGLDVRLPLDKEAWQHSAHEWSLPTEGQLALDAPAYMSPKSLHPLRIAMARRMHSVSVPITKY